MVGGGAQVTNDVEQIEIEYSNGRINLESIIKEMRAKGHNSKLESTRKYVNIRIFRSSSLSFNVFR